VFEPQHINAERLSSFARYIHHLESQAPSQYTSAYVSIRQHPSAYIRQHSRYIHHLESQAPAARPVSIRQHTSAYVSRRQQTSAYVSIRQQTSAYVSRRQHTSAFALHSSSRIAGPCSASAGGSKEVHATSTCSRVKKYMQLVHAAVESFTTLVNEEIRLRFRFAGGRGHAPVAAVFDRKNTTVGAHSGDVK
jgi:hypothetical protein